MSEEVWQIELATSDGDVAACEEILRSQPQWFGIEEAIVEYVEQMARLPTWVAREGDGVVGFVTVETHASRAAEIIVMGVHPEVHRRGVGRMLLQAVEESLRQRGVEFLQVKTLSPSRKSKSYDRTRQFYEAMGFVPLQEFPTLWDEANPCLQLVKTIDDSTGLLHHVELYVSDLECSREFWEWFLGQVGYVAFQQWDEGVSFRRGQTYLVFVQTSDEHLQPAYHRRRTGLNHLAFHAPSRRAVDEMTEALRRRGITILYEDRHPYAAGPDYYAVFFEDPDRIKVEYVAP